MKPDLSTKQLQLLDSAELLFSQKGFDGTSVRDIAEGSRHQYCDDLLLFRVQRETDGGDF